MSSTACSAEVIPPPLANETAPVSRFAKTKSTRTKKKRKKSKKATTWSASQPVRYRHARIDHVLQPGGVLRRFVVLRSMRLRDLLGQPRRREIEALHAKQEHFELRTSELWELARREAERSLRLLYVHVHEAETARLKAENALVAQAPARLSAPRVPGKVLKPSIHQGDAHGVLVDILPNGIDVLQKNGEVLRIIDLDITRALEASGAKVLETIRVTRGVRHKVQIHEQSTGSHGEGRRTLRKGRTTYEIVREAEADPTHFPAEHPDMEVPPIDQQPSHSRFRGGVR